VLHLRGLTHRYRTGPALEFPDFDAVAGERIVLGGPSGSGKSTLIALCAGLLSPQSGELCVAGLNLARASVSERDAWRGARLGVVPQRLHLSASLTVAENLVLPFLSVGAPVDRPRLRMLLDALDIGALAERRPHELSVGQAQRVALARALARRPTLLLVDEPTANLDDEAASAVLALIDRCARDGESGLLIATHDTRVTRTWPEARALRLKRPMAEPVA
jgi:putative ABC transport system ATP-binding protein